MFLTLFKLLICHAEYTSSIVTGFDWVRFRLIDWLLFNVNWWTVF